MAVSVISVNDKPRYFAIIYSFVNVLFVYGHQVQIIFLHKGRHLFLEFLAADYIS